MADMLSQEEINALLSGGDSAAGDTTDTSLLTDQEKDALGEIGNISMGTAATTLFTLLSQKVTITTPRVSEVSLAGLIDRFEDPCVTIVVDYTTGIEGSNFLIINAHDVKIITDLMMGGDGTNIPDELSELHLSAISEAMNQMIGSSSTSLSEMVGEKVDISPPEAIYDSLENLDEERTGLNPEETIIMTSFKMKIGDLIDSEIMQLMPVATAKQLVSSLMPDASEQPAGADEATSADEAAAQAQSAAPANQHQASQPQVRPPATGHAQPAVAGDPYRQAQPAAQPVNAQNVQFQNFAAAPPTPGVHGDINLIREVPLEITVELGRTSKPISEILDFTAGTVVELNKLVGESLDILANGKIIAKGEVVVVDENYGVRITEIIVPQDNWSAS